MRKGFTIIEIIIVIAIMAILATFVVEAYSRFNSLQALDKDRALISTVLNQARGLTLSSKGNNQYGVHLEPARAVLFIGGTYSAATSTNVAFTLHPQVSLSWSLSGGGADIVFERLSGEAGVSGTVTLALLGNASSTRSITVYETGVIQNN